jgi:hypothetical protein
VTEEHGASAGGIGTPSDDSAGKNGAGKMATSGDPPEVRLDGGKGDKRAESSGVFRNLQTGGGPFSRPQKVDDLFWEANTSVDLFFREQPT